MATTITSKDHRDHRAELGTHPNDCGCGDVPTFSRLRYFYGQALGAVDLRREQTYGLEKARLRNRVLHGWGIVCGLDVTVATIEECIPPRDSDDQSTDETWVAEEHAAAEKAETESIVAREVAAAEQTAPDRSPQAGTDRARQAPTVTVCSGIALDCDGNEIVVRRPSTFRIHDRLSKTDLRDLRETPGTVYVTLCYHEELVQPTRPLVTASCDPVGSCEYGGVVESYRVCVTTERPDRGPRCEPCCGACGSACLELVAIHDYAPGQPIEEHQLDFSGRRGLAVHQLTTITGINWAHGATYDRDAATALLDQGLEVVFSQPVDMASLQPGVVELLVAEGGDGRAGNVYSVAGEFVGLAAEGLVDRFSYRSTTGERLQYGDRVTITVRGDFIVDECCRAIDANHIGGAVPMLPSVEIAPVKPQSRPDCPARPSGDGVEGGEFVSWIFVQERGEAG